MESLFDARRLAALIRIFGRESCRDERFVEWLLRRAAS